MEIDVNSSLLTSKLKLLLALSCTLILANIYYAQSIITEIAVGIGLDQSLSGLIVSLTQAGYCLGVLLIVPLGDAVENKKLVMLLVTCSIPVLLAASLSQNAYFFLVCAFLIGATSCSIQVLLPMGIGLTSRAERGTLAGIMMSAAILGIVLARPASAWITGKFGWRAVYLFAAGAVSLLLVFLKKALPRKSFQAHEVSYPKILRSMGMLLINVKGLVPRLLVMFLTFSSFTMFWSALPIFLQEHFGAGHTQVALISLIGIIAPLCALFAGRMVDMGHGFTTTVLSLCLLCTSFLLTLVFGNNLQLILLAVLIFDPGVHMSNVIMQQSVLTMTDVARNRLNALCIGFNISGGAFGASLGPWLYTHFGWKAVAFTGTTFVSAALLVNLYAHRSNRLKNIDKV